MNKFLLGLVSVASLVSLNAAIAEGTPTTSTFSPTQVTEIEKVVGNFLKNNPDVITASFQAAMAKQQEEAVAKMEKAVVENKKGLFEDPATPILGNPQGSKSIVVFMDPNCGFCKKFHEELVTVLKTNKDLKIVVQNIPIMGPGSILIVKALLASKDQGKFEAFQNAVFSTDKRLTKKMLLKIAESVGLDTKKLEADMKSKTIQTQIDKSLELAKVIGVNGTPTLIIGEKTVVPGYLSADGLTKKLNETGTKTTDGKKS